MNKKQEDYLENIYYNPKSVVSFSGPDKLFRFVKKNKKFNITRKNIIKWIQSQENYTTNRLVELKFKRRRVIAPFIDYMWDSDTASLNDYRKENGGMGYFVVIIDIMSRYVWTQSVKTPNGREVRAFFEKVFKTKRIPEKVRTDKGTEFSNEIMEKFFEKYNVHHFVTQNEVKANYAERVIRTLKGRLFRYMRAKQTHKWVDELPAITAGYNNTYHRSIKRTPASVTKKDENELWKELYKSLPLPKEKKKTFKFEIGDLVRISKLRKTFQRYYSEHWTNEVFIIKGRVMVEYIAVYTLTDYANDPIIGTFYEKELQKVYITEDTTFNIEKVEEERIEKGVEESLIKWIGWPEKFNTWIATKEIIDYK